jgi:hypothetical protein
MVRRVNWVDRVAGLQQPSVETNLMNQTQSDPPETTTNPTGPDGTRRNLTKPVAATKFFSGRRYPFG